MHARSLELMSEALGRIHRVTDSPVLGDVLEVGARDIGHDYASLFIHSRSCTTANIEQGDAVELLMPGPYNIPAASESFDLVVTGQTLEHVANPFRLMREIHRVLRAGGYVIAIAPSVGRWHGEKDYWRFGPNAFEAIAEECRFQVYADWIDDQSEWRDHVFVGRVF